MTKVADILSTVAMGVCIGYVLICWGADLGRVGMMHPGVRYHLLFPAGLATTIVGFVVALIVFRRRPLLAGLTLTACFLWLIGSVLPRL